MTREVAVVTGATSGIGLHVARGLAASGRDVVIVARNRQKAEAARGEVARGASGGAQVSVELADLASLAAVDDLAARLAAGYQAMTVLVNNAGVMAAKKSLSADGIELDLAVNHVAPFLLTWRLLPTLRRHGSARVVNLSSDLHAKARLAPADFGADTPFRMMATYGTSKLANLAAMLELASRVPPAEATINAVHPGTVATNIGAGGGIMGLAWALMKPFLLSPERGAETPLWAATAPELAGTSGAYFKKRAQVPMSPRAQDRNLRDMVWAHTLRLARIGDDTNLPVAAPFLDA